MITTKSSGRPCAMKKCVKSAEGSR
jgi:hypothetical protein